MEDLNDGDAEAWGFGVIIAETVSRNGGHRRGGVMRLLILGVLAFHCIRRNRNLRNFAGFPLIFLIILLNIE